MPRIREKGSEKSIAANSPANPVSSMLRLISPPIRPQIMPMGSAKFMPAPQTIIGTIVNTSTPFIAIRVSACE